eukprot:TRINITY_DN18809_c0_g1_i1.p1 TRINITY_DN18809_c0_g1~~TRINITY_DN18809_c0_g1_i1.p1  ORF type:complete len:283 (+),score=97.54 TRINITY_DN18809_c0_g1_i1:97-945(+)
MEALEAFEVVQAMYGEGELVVHAGPGSAAIDFTVLLPLQDADEDAPPPPRRLPLRCVLPGCGGVRVAVEADGAAPWLTRGGAAAATAALRAALPCQEEGLTAAEVLTSALNWAQSKAARAALDTRTCTPAAKPLSVDETFPCEFLREWVYLPMLYSKEKRADLADYAQRYGLTGFFVAGKPACMCFEGRAGAVASCLSEVRSVSWADVPARDKKMSTMAQERSRCNDAAALAAARRFGPVAEVSFDVHGQRANHRDLALLRDWLANRGCPTAFGLLFPELKN